MSNDHKEKTLPGQERHHHADGRRCCGRPISEKCSPQEEAANTNAAGAKSCCRGKH